MKCQSIHLIRHAETVAVVKHEFMSDTSDNCAFSENGIARTPKGSCLRAMQILLRKRKHPWEDFTVSGMYHVGDDSKKKKDHGIISRVY